jgi:hypothetical protein
VKPDTQEEILKTAHLQVAKLLKKSKLKALNLQEVQQLSLLARVVSDSMKLNERDQKKIGSMTDEELRLILKEELRKPSGIGTRPKIAPNTSKAQGSQRKPHEDTKKDQINESPSQDPTVRT